MKLELVCFVPDFREGDSIKVYVRVRPPSNMEGDMDHGVCLDVGGDNNTVIFKSKPEAKVFTFDKVADIFTTQVCKCFNRATLFSKALGVGTGTVFGAI